MRLRGESIISSHPILLLFSRHLLVVPAGARMLANRIFGIPQDHYFHKMPKHTLLISIYITRNHPDPVIHLFR